MAMTFDGYLRSSGAKTMAALAREVGVSRARLSQLRYAGEWPAGLAMRIEKATGVCAAELSPIVAAARGGKK